ncbi:MAG: helix-turn-helix domain-containing protein [Clostridia bacterium]|nr:helix-turn-helix domain-containing protein [Clostridia bacterium]
MEHLLDTVAKNIRKHRLALGLTQCALGERLNYSEKSVSKWEMGQALPPTSVLPQLARCLHVSIDELMTASSSIQYYLGIDGGGTKTEFVLSDRNGRILEQVILGGSNPTDVGMQTTREVLDSGIHRICNGIPMHQISVFAGLAGGISGNNREQIRAILEAHAFGAVNNGSDGENAVATALQGRDGIVAILGTGVIAFSQQNGVPERFGGYGHFFLEHGSGFSIGSDGVLAALQEEDGSGTPTLLTSLVRQKCGCDSVLKCLPHFYQNGKKTLASYAPSVFEAYTAGDAVASEILHRHAKGVASMLYHTGKRFSGGGSIPVVLCGGLTAYGDVWLSLLREYMEDPRFEVRICRDSMVRGALYRAGLEAEIC